MPRIRPLGELELFVLLVGLSLAFGFAVPSIFEWGNSDSGAQQKFAVLQRSILLLTVAVVCLVGWAKCSNNVPPSELRKLQYTLKSSLLAFSAFGVSVGLALMLGPNRAFIAVISLELVMLGVGFYFKSLACRLGTILAIATFPFIWTVAFNRPLGHTSGLLVTIPIGPGLIPAQLVCGVAESLGRDNVSELAAIFVMSLLGIGAYLARRGGKLFWGYSFMFFILSCFSSLVMHVFYRA